MRCCVVLLMSAAVWVATGGGSLGGEPQLMLGVSGGSASYQEHVSIDPVESDWDAPTLALNARWTSADLSSAGLAARVSGAWSQSLSATEVWTERSEAVQRNDLEVHQLDVQAEVGRPFPVSSPVVLTPWGGMGFRRQGFRRADFRSGDGVLQDPGSVTEDFNIAYLSLALELDGALSSTWQAFVGAGVAYVFLYDAQNSALGDIRGGDGTLFDVDAGLRYAMGGGQELGLGIIYTAQSLGGAVETHRLVGPDGLGRLLEIELPDNDYTQVAMYIRWRRAL